MPSGASGTTATSMASASPSPPGNTWPTRALEQDVGGPEPAGDQRERDADPVESAAAEVRQQQDAGGRQGDPDQVERPARAEHRDAERPDELERDRDAQRDAVERRVEGGVHPGEREAEQRSASQSRGRLAP